LKGISQVQRFGNHALSGKNDPIGVVTIFNTPGTLLEADSGVGARDVIIHQGYVIFRTAADAYRALERIDTLL
jgi:hypothetical protein